jgi:hypothetical protein
MGGRRSEKEMIFSFSPLRSNSRSSPFFFSDAVEKELPQARFEKNVEEALIIKSLKYR